MELCAVEVAQATPYVREVIEAAHQVGRSLAAVSNNSREAVTRYRTTVGLAPLFTTITGRADPAAEMLAEPVTRRCPAGWPTKFGRPAAADDASLCNLG